jgi:hypothetical protein
MPFAPIFSLFLRLEPLLYRVLVCGAVVPHRLQAIFDGASPGSTDFVERHVRHILIEHNLGPTSIEKTLSACSGATNIAFFTYAEPACLPYLERIRPARLSINIRYIFGGPPAFPSPMFSNITHLEIWNNRIPENTKSLWMGVTSLPRLTHLSFSGYERLPQGFLHMVLKECKPLRALIILVEDFEITQFQGPKATLYDQLLPIHDLRFVISCRVGPIGDWVAGAWGHNDDWAQADNFIRLKRRGGIPSELIVTSGLPMTILLTRLLKKKTTP